MKRNYINISEFVGFCLKRLILVCYIASAFLIFDVNAQNINEIGSPFIHNYTSQHYKASAQNWSCIQDNRGILYFGNNLGLLEFDGVNWKLFKVNNKSMIRDISLNSNNEIFYGSNGELGQLVCDSIGSLSFRSLNKLLLNKTDVRY